VSDRFVIHQGDSLAILRTLPDASIDALVTDPPYSSGGMFRGDRTKSTGDKYVHALNGIEGRADFMGDNRDQRSFGYWCALWLSECRRVAKPGALCAIFTDWRQLPSMTDAVQAGGWLWRGIVPWNKTEGARPQKGWFRAQCEYLVVGANGVPAMLDPTGKTDAPALPGFFTCTVGRDNEHQTQKPVDLMRWILAITPPGGTVLDPFAGSGTTGVAALLEGRRFIGCELSDHYAAIARRRCMMAAHQGTEQSIFDMEQEQSADCPPPAAGVVGARTAGA